VDDLSEVFTRVCGLDTRKPGNLVIADLIRLDSAEGSDSKAMYEDEDDGESAACW